MDSYKIVFKKTAVKDLKKLPVEIIKKLNNVIAALSENPLPPGNKKLIGTKSLYRIRIGDYRVIYNIFNEDKIITIHYIRHRKDIYRSI